MSSSNNKRKAQRARMDFLIFVLIVLALAWAASLYWHDTRWFAAVPIAIVLVLVANRVIRHLGDRAHALNQADANQRAAQKRRVRTQNKNARIATTHARVQKKETAKWIAEVEQEASAYQDVQGKNTRPGLMQKRNPK